MKKFNIGLAYGRTPEAEKEMSNQALTADYIGFAVSSRYDKGLEGQKRRVFARIQRKLDEAVEAKSRTIDLEEAEIDFIGDAFEHAQFPAALSKYVVVVEEELARMRQEGEPKAKK